MFKKELLLIFHKLFQDLEQKGLLPNSFYVASISVIPKPDKDIRKENNRAISLMIYKCENPQQNITKPNPVGYKVFYKS